MKRGNTYKEGYRKRQKETRVNTLIKAELNAVLAGLRLLQARVTPGSSRSAMDVIDILTDEGTDDPLTTEEIDRLCERIN